MLLIALCRTWFIDGIFLRFKMISFNKKGLREISAGPFYHHPSMSICFFSGSFSLSFLGRVRLNTPCLKLALTSSSLMFSPT